MTQNAFAARSATTSSTAASALPAAVSASSNECSLTTVSPVLSSISPERISPSARLRYSCICTSSRSSRPTGRGSRRVIFAARPEASSAPSTASKRRGDSGWPRPVSCRLQTGSATRAVIWESSKLEARNSKQIQKKRKRRKRTRWRSSRFPPFRLFETCWKAWPLFARCSELRASSFELPPGGAALVREKAFSQCAPADLAALVRRNLGHDPHLARNLPRAQPALAKAHHRRRLDTFARDTSDRFLAAQRGRHAEDDDLFHTRKFREPRLHFERIELAAGDVDDIRDAAGEVQPALVAAQEIAWNEAAFAERCAIAIWKVIIADGRAAHHDRRGLRARGRKLDAAHRLPDETLLAIRLAARIVRDSPALR